MNVAIPLLCLIAVLGLLTLLQAHHPWAPKGEDRALAVVAAAQGLVVLVLAVTQLLDLVRP